MRVGLLYREAATLFQKLDWLYFRSQTPPFFPPYVTVDVVTRLNSKNNGFVQHVVLWIDSDIEHTVARIIGEPETRVKSIEELKKMGYWISRTKHIGQLRL